jgi:hypothetical protein
MAIGDSCPEQIENGSTLNRGPKGKAHLSATQYMNYFTWSQCISAKITQKSLPSGSGHLSE